MSKDKLKEKIIEILKRCLEDKGKLPEFFADQILEEIKEEIMGVVEKLPRSDESEAFQQGEENTINRILEIIKNS